MADTPTLTLVVPTYNEADRLADGLARLARAVADGSVDPTSTELLVVDDGSTDGTVSIARELIAAYPHARLLPLPRNRGKGAAVRAGLLDARGDAVAFCDADMAIDPAHLPALCAALDRAPVAVGSRAVHGRVEYGSRLRTDAGRVFNLAVRALGRVGLDDTQCGFKGFRRGAAVLLALLQTTDGYAFDVEVLWLAGALGLAVEAVPVTWLDVPGSSVQVVPDSIRMLLDVAAARRRPRWVGVVELEGPVPSSAPPATVVVRGAGRALLVGGVGALGAMRAVAPRGAQVRVAGLDELLALAPVEVEPGVTPPATPR